MYANLSLVIPDGRKAEPGSGSPDARRNYRDRAARIAPVTSIETVRRSPAARAPTPPLPRSEGWGDSGAVRGKFDPPSLLKDL